jgi:anti-sigma B factor antagonist
MDMSSTAPFSVHVRVDGADVNLELVGEFDMSAVESFRSCAEGALDCNGGAIVVDLADVTFIDSTGISALLEMRRRLDAEGRELRVENVSSPAARIFELTGLTDVFVDGDGDATPAARINR